MGANVKIVPRRLGRSDHCDEFLIDGDDDEDAIVI